LADRHENFTHDWKGVHLDNVGLKIWASYKTILGTIGLGVKSLSLLSQLTYSLPSDGK